MHEAELPLYHVFSCWLAPGVERSWATGGRVEFEGMQVSNAEPVSGTPNHGAGLQTMYPHRNACIGNVGKYQSCMEEKLRITYTVVLYMCEHPYNPQ